ncbi:MAG: exosortase A [Halioglobus sp.]|jgi:exosortase A
MAEKPVSNSSLVRNALCVAGLYSFVLLLIYFGTSWSMVAIWSRSDTFAHGFLVLPITLWLVWNRWSHLQTVHPEPAPAVAFLLLPPAAAWLVSWMVDVDVIQQLALVTMLIVSVWAILGHRLARLLAFPLLFVYFAVPMGEGLIPPMMEFTATSTVWLIKLTGIPVYREGLHFSLPSGYWSVVEACSGVRYIIASATVGTLYAYLTYRSWQRRGLFVLASLIVPVFANTLRAFMIVMLGHFSGMTIATGADHLVYGWVFFGVVIFVLFWVGSFFREEEMPVPAADTKSDSSGKQRSSSNAKLMVTILAVLLPASIGPLMAYRSASESEFNSALQLTLPAAQSEWESLEILPWYWELPTRVGGEETAVYGYAGQPLAVMIQYDDGTIVGGDVVGSSTLLAGWHSGSRVAALTQTTASLQGTAVLLDEARIVGVDDDLLVWSWYNVGGLSTANAYVAKLQQARSRLGFGYRGTYRIVLATPVGDTPEPTRVILQEFMDQHGELLYEELQRAVDQGAP